MGDFKPSDLFLGVVELFAVLLPGALLTGGVLLAFGNDIRAQLGQALPNESAGWVAFAVVSYSLGAFVFFPASALDTGADKALKKARDRAEADARAKKARETGWKDSAPNSTDPKLTDYAYRAAEERRKVYFSEEATEKGKPLDAFNWAKAMLMLHAPAAYSDVQRYEAESKFFRSMVIVAPSVGLLALWAWQRNGWQTLAIASGLAVIVTVFSWFRYVNRRRKAVEWACRYVVTLRTGQDGANSA